MKPSLAASATRLRLASTAQQLTTRNARFVLSASTSAKTASASPAARNAPTAPALQPAQAARQATSTTMTKASVFLARKAVQPAGCQSQIVPPVLALTIWPTLPATPALSCAWSVSTFTPRSHAVLAKT